jgi:hypothetical protein
MKIRKILFEKELDSNTYLVQYKNYYELHSSIDDTLIERVDGLFYEKPLEQDIF